MSKATDLVSYSDEAKTMSSREIAELTGKAHAHVCRDIRKQLAELGIGESKFGSTYWDAQGKERTEYLLDHEQTMILISGYNVVLRAKVVARWMELEGKPRGLMTRLELAEEQVRMIRAYDEAQAEASRLKVELDYAHEWATIKRIEKVTGRKFCWRELKRGSIEIDCPRKEIFDANYGEVKSYHRDLWMHCYDIDISEILKTEGLPKLS